MPVVNTTQNFATGDTVTSTSLNNIMDQSVFVAGAVVAGDGLTVTAGGQVTIENLKVTGGKIGDLEISTAKIANDAITTAKIANLNVTQEKLALDVSGTGPVFRAYPASSQSIPTATDTKIILANEDYDTNSNFASSRFTPTVAGYYLIKGSVGFPTARTSISANIYKNGSLYSAGTRISGTSTTTSTVDIVYLNGSTDYVELYTRHVEGTSVGTELNSNATNFSGCLIRSA